MMAQMNLSDMDAMDMGGPPVGSRDTTRMEMDMPGMDEEN
jgi:hypothetical protein